MPNSVTMIKRSSLILISSAAEAHFFVPEYHLTDILILLRSQMYGVTRITLLLHKEHTVIIR